ncbi:MAG: glycosyltransferase [Candidatus Altiarchaeota archaeon]|nr:glycosyltransferase [Candidatus Altiarchaeota archaeon]
MHSVYIPAYNEEKIIKATVSTVAAALKGLDCKLTVVDDASTDKTAKICSEIGVDCVSYGFGPTRRENLADAMRKSEADKIAYIDADLSVKPAYLPGFFKLLDEFDIVISSRYLPQSKIKRKIWRDVFSRMSSYFIRHYIGSKIIDHQCGLKAFRREVLFQLIDEMGYDKTLNRGWAWDTEMLLRAQKKGIKILEVPVEWNESRHTSVDVFTDWRMVAYSFTLGKRLK